MPLNKARPFRVRPRSLADSLDSSNSPPGSMSALANLIPDPGTPACLQCRPAAQIRSNFDGFTNPQVVTAALQVGSRIYGMVGTDLNLGKDQPFVYDTTSQSFITVDGITNDNTPTTPATTGVWSPPSMVAVGTLIIVTHPGFPGGSGPYFGWFDVSGFTENTVGNITSASPTITGNPNIQGVTPGMNITGTGIPLDTRIVNFENVVINTTVTLIGSSTSATITGPTGGIVVGQVIAGLGISLGTTVDAISGTSLTLSVAALSNQTDAALTFTGATITMSANATANTDNLTIAIAGGTTNDPLWSAGNTSGAQLPAVPTFVSNYNNRAYFATGPFATFTDVLTLNITSLTQTLTIGDPSPIYALCPLAIVTTTGIVVLGLIAFKENYISQIAGDPTTGDLSQNALTPEGCGTTAPRSVCSTPQGILFRDADGIRMVTQYGTVSDPLTDVREPFISAVEPTRISAAFNKGVYRICIENEQVAGTPFQEYWFDFKYKMWSGPHTFRQDLAVPIGSSFYAFSNAFPGKIYQADQVQNDTSGFVENGTNLSWTYSLNKPDNENLMMDSLVVSSINIAFKAGAPPLQCVAQDEDGTILDVCDIAPPGTASIWGSFTWGVNIWFGSQYGLKPNIIPWTVPLCFSKLTLTITSLSSLGFQISNFQALTQSLGYVATPYGFPADSSPVPPPPVLQNNWDVVGLAWEQIGLLWSA